MARPQFTSEQRDRLKRLSVTPLQIVELETALIHVRLALSKPAARNTTAGLLDDVAKLADKLLKRTTAIEIQTTVAHSHAHVLIEEGYWRIRPDDGGPHSFDNLAPRLEALRDAAREGKKKLPRTPSRHRTANPAPVREIADALRRGWTKEHGSNVFHVRYEDSREIKSYQNGPMRMPFPPSLIASAADSSAFRAIVGICYETEGGNSDPLAAIKNYLKKERELRAEMRSAMEAGIASANKRRNRSAKKR